MELLLGNTEDALESGDVRTKQQRIAKLAGLMPEAGFTSLAYYIDLEWMYEAYKRVRKDGAAGVDEVTAEEYEKGLDGNLRSLLERFKSGRYYAPPVKRVYIPKGDGRKRPIGIPALEDKILQRAVVMVLEPLFETDFLEVSYGFRPDRSVHDALEALWKEVMEMGGCWVLEVDIKSYLETSSYCTPFHEGLSKRLGWLSNTLIRIPFRLPRQTWTAESSPRFTRCNTVCRETPRSLVASCTGTWPSGVCSTKRDRNSSFTRMRHGAPGVTCSPAMKPSASQR